MELLPPQETNPDFNRQYHWHTAFLFNIVSENVPLLFGIDNNVSWACIGAETWPGNIHIIKLQLVWDWGLIIVVAFFTIIFPPQSSPTAPKRPAHHFGFSKYILQIWWNLFMDLKYECRPLFPMRIWNPLTIIIYCEAKDRNSQTKTSYYNTAKRCNIKRQCQNIQSNCQIIEQEFREKGGGGGV